MHPLYRCDALRGVAYTIERELREYTYLRDALLTLDESQRGPDSAEYAELARQAAEMGLSDIAPSPSPPPPPPPPPPKAKREYSGPKAGANRLPYQTYIGFGGAEIRVGRQAGDNTALSTDSRHSHTSDWWLHAAHCPGSHVVIRHSSLPVHGELPNQVMLDGAVLAANFSKVRAKLAVIPVKEGGTTRGGQHMGGTLFLRSTRYIRG